MPSEERRRDDDFMDAGYVHRLNSSGSSLPGDDLSDDVNDPSVRKAGRGTVVILGLILGITALMFFTCLCGVGLVAWVAVYPYGVHPDEYVGTWKGRFLMDGQLRDYEYTFDKSGWFQEARIGPDGRRMYGSTGRWRFREGRIEIDFGVAGATEVADAVFVDRDTIQYRIVNHSDRTQIGLSTTFRRK